MRMEQRNLATMTVHDVMTEELHFTNAGKSITEAAKVMQLQNFGILPVGNEYTVTGTITDRDIVVRVIAQDKSPDATIVGEIMSKDAWSCLEFDDLRIAVNKMHKHNANHLLVKNDADKITGIILLRDILRGLYF